MLYLGIISSGLGFFLWNAGAVKVNVGVLAVFNDLKIPLAVAVSLLVFGEKANLTNLLVGGVIVAAALLISRRDHSEESSMPQLSPLSLAK